MPANCTGLNVGKVQERKEQENAVTSKLNDLIARIYVSA